MFKLLTEETRQKVAREYIVRRVIIALSGVTLALTVGIIGLLPSYVFSNARQKEMLEQTRIMSNVRQKRGNESELQAWLAKINAKLEVLSPALDTDRPSDFIERVLNQKIKGVVITGLSWAKVKDKIALSASGVALDRQALITFENRINASGYFSDITLPISNLAQDRDINFEIKFSLAKPLAPTQTP